jgi:hypothetical protein
MNLVRKSMRILAAISTAVIMITILIAPALAQQGPEIRVTDSQVRADHPDVAVDSNDNVHITYSDEVASWYQTFGSSPNRYTVIEWHTPNLDTNLQGKFQVVLYENGDIDINIADNTGAVGQTPITGVNKDGTDGVDIGVIPSSETSYRFTWDSVSDYSYSAITYNWIECSASGTTVGAQGDDSSASVPIGFDFTFYEFSYDTVYVSSNGYMSFTDTDPDYSVGPGSFPSSDSDAANVISPLWEDWNPDYRHIWYTMLDNNGNTLIDDTMISTAVEWDAVRPAIAVDSNDMVHIVWQDQRWDSSTEIAYTKLDPSQDDQNGGAADEAAITVVDDTQLTDLGKDYQIGPRIAVDSSDNIHIVWEDKDEDNIYYMQISDDGSELVAETVLRSAYVSRASPDISVDSNNNPHITWNDYEDTDNYETYYMMLDGSDGSTLIDATLITPDDDLQSKSQSIVVDGEDMVHIIWKDKRGDGMAAYYTKLDPSQDDQSGDAAADTSPFTVIDDKILSVDDTDYWVKRIASGIGCGKYIHLSWWEEYTEDLYYMVLDTDGNPIVTETSLTTTGSVTTSKGVSGVYGWMVPYLAVDSNSKAHITWVDDRDDPSSEDPIITEVYYTSFEGPSCEAPSSMPPPPGCTLFEYCTTNCVNAVSVYGDYWSVQTFMALSDHAINSVALQLYKTGTPGALTVSIQDTVGGLPSGTDLGTGMIYEDEISAISFPGEWVGTSIDEVQLTSGETYALLVRVDGDSANYVSWFSSDIYASDPTPMLDLHYSSNAGGDWASYEGFSHGFSLHYCEEEEPPPLLVGAVGGEAYPINKFGLVAPWVALAVAIVTGGLYLVRRRVNS